VQRLPHPVAVAAPHDRQAHVGAQPAPRFEEAGHDEPVQARARLDDELAHCAQHVARRQRRDVRGEVALDLHVRDAPALALLDELAQRLGAAVVDARVGCVRDLQPGVADLVLDRELVGEHGQVERGELIAKRDQLAHLGLDRGDPVVQLPHEVHREPDERPGRVGRHGVGADHPDPRVVERRDQVLERRGLEDQVGAGDDDDRLVDRGQKCVDRDGLAGANLFFDQDDARIVRSHLRDDGAGIVGAAAGHHDDAVDAVGDRLFLDAAQRAADVRGLVVGHDPDDDRAIGGDRHALRTPVRTARRPISASNTTSGVSSSMQCRSMSHRSR